MQNKVTDFENPVWLTKSLCPWTPHSKPSTAVNNEGKSYKNLKSCSQNTNLVIHVVSKLENHSRRIKQNCWKGTQRALSEHVFSRDIRNSHAFSCSTWWLVYQLRGIFMLGHCVHHHLLSLGSLQRWWQSLFLALNDKNSMRSSVI